MSIASAIGVAVIFCWIGMVLAISFLEAPLKFRAPNVTLPIGLGIGRLVFRALNTVEVVFAAVVLVVLLSDPPQTAVLVAVAVAVVALAAQVIAVRPRLTRRSDAVLAAGPDAENLPRSQAHYAYVALEVLKLAGLFTGGILLLAG
ncbi:hypothetical protein [Mycolicibacterium smegmatis]|jgi:hypothetical protein|uniref:hypothetical protein n=1 Tax=Mycolicibacterium smegmatis TaxID=1772 RepID=UPI0005D93EA4|nr:hypothetical protein [Mycolicibacterium smegmatis]MCP2621429.1 hypothetical protein [Mycolicibacterium smegmatis]MDF1903479.1 hypothetical protein [Mycolicibacterium smegmatis]MDF1910018.1 hypothetical protein [Mycolicibacterium smegmatis]MDF1921874.1 hypothetical protein [Mycolicibacterium smegmatis]MDF1928370.1 hypothetical protein [Mycolicibacterium smegmatis]